VILACLFIAAGVMHFVIPDLYARILPPALPFPHLLVLVSGIAEIFGGIGLLVPLFQRSAAWSLAVLLVAVFPANVYTALAHLPFPGLFGQTWAQWIRLPLQVPLILWTLSYTRRQSPSVS
jgi:uncharacterized membrane protein